MAIPLICNCLRLTPYISSQHLSISNLAKLIEKCYIITLLYKYFFRTNYLKKLSLFIFIALKQ